MLNSPLQARLRWSCRRGMLELDLLLLPFLEKQFTNITPEEQELFRELLACEDQDLHSWLVAGQSPTELRFDNLIKRIRACT